MVKVRIQRCKPGNPETYYETYEVPLSPGMSVLGVLNYVREKFDSSLGYYVSCRHGRCGECTVMVNGKAKLSCLTPAKGSMTLQPIRGYEIMRDLVVDPSKRSRSTSK